MDTRFWGPSGWQLFHLIAEGSPTPERTLRQMHLILPCRFCRESTTKFVTEHPLKGDTGRWLYEIHRKVNHKLKTQAEADPKVILPDPDPTYEDVHEKYEQILKKPPHAVPGRDFLFSIAYNYPEKPEKEDINTQEAFLRELKTSYPFLTLRKVVAKYMDSHPIQLKSRNEYVRWMYGLLRRLSEKTNSPIRTFKGYTHHVAYYKSGCTKPTYHGKTCRRVEGGGYTKQRNPGRTRRIVSKGLLS